MKTFFEKILLLAAIGSALVLTSCGETKPQPGGKTKWNTLVVYFSVTNHTKAVADTIADVLNCDSWRIEPVVPYPEDMVSTDPNCRAVLEQAQDSLRVPFKNPSDLDLSDYDVIYVGFPIWKGKLPRVMCTFLETYDFYGKRVIPFCTSGHSDISGPMKEIEDLISSKSVGVIYGQHFTAAGPNPKVADWVHKVHPAFPLPE